MMTVLLFTDSEGDLPDLRGALVKTSETRIVAKYPVPPVPAATDRDEADVIIVWSAADGREGLSLLRTLRGNGDTIQFVIVAKIPEHGVASEALARDAEYYIRPATAAGASAALSKIVGKTLETQRLWLTLAGKEKQVHALFDQSPVGMMLLNKQCCPVDVNPALLRIFGAPGKEQIEKLQLIDLLDLSESQKQQLASHESIQTEIVFDFDAAAAGSEFPSTKSGTIVLEILAIPLCEPGSPQCDGYLVNVRDISELKYHKDALARLDKKLSLVGSVTRHDVLNQLTAIIGYNELLTMMIEDPKLSGYLGKERAAIEKIQRQFRFAITRTSVPNHRAGR